MLNVGIDWGLSGSYYVILSDDGEIVKDDPVGSSFEDIMDFADMLLKMAPETEQIRVGIDRKRCPLVSVLLSEELTVYALNPKSTDRARDIFQPAGEKDDGGDAFVHAQMVRMSHRRLSALEKRDDLHVKLSCLLRTRRAQVKMRSKLYQMLNSMLADWARGLYRLCPALQRTWVQDLLAEFPLDQDLATVHGNALNRFIRNHRMAPETERKIREFREQPYSEYDEQMAQFRRKQIRSHLDLIQTISEKVKEAESQIADLLEGSPEAAIFRTLPAQGDLTVAALVVLFGTDRTTDRNWRQYASFAGVSPITKESGNTRKVVMRKACDEMLRDALIDLAFATYRKDDCWASDYYRRKRDEGQSHHSALRRLAHRWVKILYFMWKRQADYDEDYHRRRRRERGGIAA
jgi:transposase